jgi:hypothetical protein
MSEYRRRLPHFHRDDAYLFLTWRLWGSLPQAPVTRPYPTPGHAFAPQDVCGADQPAGGYAGLRISEALHLLVTDITPKRVADP